MVYYLTFNDNPSGIFSSQVIGVVNFIQQELQVNIRLVSFISLRNFKSNRDQIRNECPNALILPMIPRVHRWRMNRYLLRLFCYISKPDAIIGRSVLATQLAFESGIRKVVYDGRGAISAEWNEYMVINDPVMLSEIERIEGNVILNTQFRIAVSEKLVDYWREAYDYKDSDHVVIPCTLNNAFEKGEIDEKDILALRKKLNFDTSDIVFVYSGSVAGWQSFNLLEEFMRPLLESDKRNKLHFLSELNDNICGLMRVFPSQVSNSKVAPHEVPANLLVADYGLLIRDQSITNKVASPVKFAEYLACGLKVIISENLGDYSNYICKNDCGYLFSKFPGAYPISISEKQKIRAMALRDFTKESQVEKLKKLFAIIEN